MNLEIHEGELKPQSNVRANFFRAALVLALLFFAFFQWVLWPVKVMGNSMLPTFHDGNRYFVNKFAYLSHKPQRGDIVCVRIRSGEIYVKRVIAVPGETVELQEGRFLINGEFLDENYTRTRIPATWEPDIWTGRLGDGDYFVAGDNRAVSVLGVVPEYRIIGKVVF